MSAIGKAAMMLVLIGAATAAGAADLKFLQHLQQTLSGTSNLKAAPEYHELASAPLLPKFVSENAETNYELRKRGTSAQNAPDPQRQQEEQSLRTAPDLGLSAAQKQTIYISISNLNLKETAPPTFRAAVGSVVPDTIKLQPLPKTIVQLMPQTEKYEYALVANQVLLVDPQSKKIVEVISE